MTAKTSFGPVDRRALLSVLGTAALAACSGKAAGTGPTLRVADQLRFMQAIFRVSGQDRALPGYAIEWSNFVSGPAVVSAATGGSVDVGWMASTPVLFAQAAGSPIRVISAFKTLPAPDGGSSMGLIARTGSGIHTLADLKGKRFCYPLGTIGQYIAYLALRRAGLTFADVHAVNSTVDLAGQLLAGNQVDALIAVEPLLSSATLSGKAQVIANGPDLVREVHYLVAPDTALAHRETVERIGDFVGRMAKAMQWWRDNPQGAAQEAARLYQVPVPVGASIARHITRQVVPVTRDIVAFQQEQSDVFHALGQIPRKVDAAAVFDDRYDAAIGRAGTRG